MHLYVVATGRKGEPGYVVHGQTVSISQAVAQFNRMVRPVVNDPHIQVTIRHQGRVGQETEGPIVMAKYFGETRVVIEPLYYELPSRWMSLDLISTALVVPPVNLLLPCLGGLALLGRRRRRMGVMLLGAGLVGLTVLGMPLVSRTLLVALETDLVGSAVASDPPQAIVILSGDVAGNAGRLDVGSLTLERERAGAALHRATHLPILVTGGVAEEAGETLAALMAHSLQTDFQVPVGWIEPEARDTRENARLSAAMLRADGIGSIYLVTHGWHMKRSLQAFAATRLHVTPIPVRLDDPAPRTWESMVPRARSWEESYYALHEWLGWAVSQIGLR